MLLSAAFLSFHILPGCPLGCPAKSSVEETITLTEEEVVEYYGESDPETLEDCAVACTRVVSELDTCSYEGVADGLHHFSCAGVVYEMCL